MVLHGNSEIGAHVKSSLCYLICLRHLTSLGVVKNRIFFLRPNFLHACATYFELPSNISTMEGPKNGNRNQRSEGQRRIRKVGLEGVEA